MRKRYSSIYLKYCKSQGYRNDPDGMLAHDREVYPGGKMAGFIAWRLEQLFARRGQVREPIGISPGVMSARRGQYDHRDRTKKLPHPSGLGLELKGTDDNGK